MNSLAEKISELTDQKSGVKRLTLTDFRNYDFLRLNLELAPIIITGENGSGKTNILEAVSFLTPGRGLRGAKLADIKRIVPNDNPENFEFGHSPVNWAVSASVQKNDEDFEIGTASESQQKDETSRTFERRIVKIDNQKISSQAELGKYISAIWLTPQMDRLFRGGAQPRRSFLDRMVYAFDIEHAKRTSQFEHLYKEWSELIKSGRFNDSWLTILEKNMAETGVAIAAARKDIVERLNTFISDEPDDVFPNVSIELDGTIEKMLDSKPALAVEDYYAAILANQRQSVLYSDNSEGINRTDFKVYYKKKNMAAELCSTGEQKSLLIGLILAQTKCQILDKGFAPVLLLDEVVAHLDTAKKEALIEKIKALKIQAFITATDASLFDSMKDCAQFLSVRNGVVF